MNPSIFREYDIRGIADTDLNDEVVELIGRAYGTRAVRAFGDGVRIGVGYDMRVSSSRIFEALARGLMACGVTVVELGMVPTPLVYFAKFTENIDGCMQITGSHNPGEYNGCKMMLGTDTLHGPMIQELRQAIEARDFVEGNGSQEKLDDLVGRYSKWLGDNITMGDRKLNVVVDCGNGVTGVLSPDVIRDVLGCEVTGMFTTPDGTFPNHHPDPTVEENLVDLQAKVAEVGADLGVAYDGDGDRIGVVGGDGAIIWGDKLLILLARNVLEENPGATIIGEVKCSQTLFDDIAARGGKPYMSRVGHSVIKTKIKELGAKLAGEMSGHIFYNDRFFGFDDALYTTARLLEILSSTDKTITELLSDVPQTFVTPEIRLDCEDAVKFDVPGVVAAEFAASYETNTIDGVRVTFPDGWGLVRASNTQPALVLRVEAATAAGRDSRLAELRAAVVRAEASLR